MNIKKNDKIQVLTGKDKGKTGKVLQVLVDKNKLSVEGVNLHFKNVLPKKQGEKGQKIQYPAALSVSNVILLCPKCNKPTRVSYKILENNKKVRVCKKCKSNI